MPPKGSRSLNKKKSFLGVFQSSKKEMDKIIIKNEMDKITIEQKKVMKAKKI